MIGLMVFGIFLLWIWLAIYLSLKIPKWFNWKWKNLISGLLIPLIAFAPFIDELIGKYQYQRLCEKYSIGQAATPNQSYTTLTPILQVTIELTNVIKPTHVSVQQYIERDGKKPIRSDRAVWQSDGWFLRWLGLAGQSHCSSTSIWKISPQENTARINRSWAAHPVKQHIKSSTQELSRVLEKFDIAKE